MPHRVRFLGIGVCAVVLGGLPVAAMADTWDDYLSFMNQRYYLDQRSVKSVSCHIASPTLDALLGTLKKGTGDSVIVTHNFEDVTLTYSREGGVSFSPFSFDAVLSPHVTSKEPERVQRGIAMTKLGVQKTVEGIKELLSLFIREELTSPRRGSIQNLAMKNVNGKIHISYDAEGNHIEDVYKGGAVRSTMTGKDLEGSATGTFGQHGGKLVVTDMEAALRQGAVRMSQKLHVQYQDLGRTLFPLQLTQEVALAAAGGVQQTTSIVVNLKDCHVVE